MITRYSYGNKSQWWFEIRPEGERYVIVDQQGDSYGIFNTYAEAAREARFLLG